MATLAELRAESARMRSEIDAINAARGGGESPPPCVTDPKGSEQLQFCLQSKCNLMLIRWLGCASKPDPAACRTGVEADYYGDIADCYKKVGDQA